MKRRVLIRHLRAHDCELLREGSKHSVYFNPTRLKTSGSGGKEVGLGSAAAGVRDECVKGPCDSLLARDGSARTGELGLAGRPSARPQDRRGREPQEDRGSMGVLLANPLVNDSLVRHDYQFGRRLLLP